jgi:hypothetical protein
VRSVNDSGRHDSKRRRAVRLRIRKLRITITPGAAIEGSALAASWWVITWLAASPTHITLDTVPPALLFGAACFAAALAHEAGHVLCSLALRRRVHTIHVGASSFIHHDQGHPVENLLILTAGPITQILAGITLLAAGFPAGNTAIMWAGIFSMASGSAQLLPIGPVTADGRKIWRSITLRPSQEIPDSGESLSKAA